MELILFLWAPLVIGTVWGAWRGHRDRFSFPVLFIAPLVSGVLTCGVMVAVGILSDKARGNPDRPDRFAYWLATTYLLGPGICFFGAVPALVGSATGQLIKLWGSSRLRGRGEFPDIQAESGAAVDRRTNNEE